MVCNHGWSPGFIQKDADYVKIWLSEPESFAPAWYFLHLGRCYKQKGQYEEALSVFEKAHHRSPDSLSTHLALAQIYVLLNRQEEPNAEAKKVLEIDSNFSIKTVNKAKILEAKKLLWYHIAQPNFCSLIILQIRQGDYTLFSANIFVGLRAWIESFELFDIILYLIW